MIHVTHVVAHPPYREGTGTACYYNARALRDLGCEVAVYVPKRKLRDSDRQLDFYRFMPCWLAVENAFLTPELLSLPKTDIEELIVTVVTAKQVLKASTGVVISAEGMTRHMKRVSIQTYESSYR